MTLIAFVLSVMIGIGSLAWGYAAQGHVEYMRWLLLLGVVWLFMKWRNWNWFSPWALLVVVISAAYGLWIELPFGWMMLGAIGGLLAWDLTDFSKRLSYAAPSDDVAGMQRRHLARVGIVAGLGGLLGLIAFVVRIQLPFEVVAGLVILTVLGLARLITTLRKE